MTTATPRKRTPRATPPAEAQEPRTGAGSAAEPVPETAGSTQRPEEKTLLGVGRHTAAALSPPPVRDPAACVLCGEHVDWPLAFAYAPPYPVCRDIHACLGRAFGHSAPGPAGDALEPIPEMTA